MAGQADDVMTRSEEWSHAGTTTEQTGQARLRKYVVTANVQQSVPVNREEVRVERKPVTEANRDAAMAGRRYPGPSMRSPCTRNGRWWRRKRCR
jgi:stress response protein YsnF